MNSTLVIMDDVLPPVGGFLPCRVNEGGYIYHSGVLFTGMVHRETRNLHEVTTCCRALADAKSLMGGRNDEVLLELTSDGGGRAVWCKRDQVELIQARLSKWKGCYGTWPILILGE
jgi:hypothetical protein